MVIKATASLLLENGNVYELDFLPTKEEVKELRQAPEDELIKKYRFIGNEKKVTINDLENGE